MNKLTIKQKMTLEAIEYFININGYSPTFRELSELLKKDIKTIFLSVIQLEKKGYIKTGNSKARSIVILKK